MSLDRKDPSHWDWWCPMCKLGVIDQEVTTSRPSNGGDSRIPLCPKCSTSLIDSAEAQP